MFKSYVGLPRPIYFLFAGRIINRMGDFVHFFLAIYLTNVLEMSESAAGSFIMVYGLLRLAGGFIGGKLADSLGRKKATLLVNGAAGAIIGLCGFFVDSPNIAYLVVSSGLFAGAFRPVTQAMLTDLTRGKERQTAFSLLYLGTNIGVAVGPLIAGFLFEHALRWIFWGDGITTGIYLLAVLFFVPETVPGEGDEEPDSPGERRTSDSTIQAFLRRPVLVVFSLLMLLAAMIYSQHTFTLPLQLGVLFGDRGARYFGYIMSANAVTVILCTTLVLRLTKRSSSLRNIFYSSLFLALGFGALGFTEYLPVMVMLTVIWTVGEVLLVTNEGVYLASHTPINLRGRFAGLLAMVSGVGFVVGPKLSGMLLESLSYRALWRLSGLAALVLAFSLLILERREQAERPERTRSFLP